MDKDKTNQTHQKDSLGDQAKNRASEFVKTGATTLVLKERKNRHLEILKESEAFVDHQKSDWDKIHINVEALTHIDGGQVSCQTQWLNQKISMPIFISCMSGGADRFADINHKLAKIAQKLNIPLGLGSSKILFKHPECIDQFSVREYAPTIPIFSNLGAEQLEQREFEEIFELNLKLGVSAQVLHFNSAQQYMQSNPVQYQKSLDILEEFQKQCPIPVIVKEVGWGFNVLEIKTLLDKNVQSVDLAGAGGVSWPILEALVYQKDPLWSQSLRGLGHSTAMSLISFLRIFPSYQGKLWASGGVYQPQDIFKAMVLGAQLVGIGYPIMKLLIEQGEQAVLQHLTTYQEILTFLLMSCNCKDWKAAQRKYPLWIEDAFEKNIHQYIYSQKLAEAGR